MATVTADSAGYVLPSSGAASTTQFYLGPELGSGTACGVDALPNGQNTSGRQGGGPGYLYVRVPSLPNTKPYLRLSRQPSTNSPSVPTLSLQWRRPRLGMRSLKLDHTRLLSRRSALGQRIDLQDHRRVSSFSRTEW
jgi:hypothetical protein